MFVKHPSLLIIHRLGNGNGARTVWYYDNALHHSWVHSWHLYPTLKNPIMTDDWFCIQMPLVFWIWFHQQCVTRNSWPASPLFIPDYHMISELRDWYFELRHRFEIRLARRQQYWWDTRQISARLTNSNHKSRGFKTSYDCTSYWKLKRPKIPTYFARAVATQVSKYVQNLKTF